MLPADTAPGDVVLLDCCGAYGFCMASTYNLRPLPSETVGAW
jgi:diaminopimelate decarboxylase/aspartate kinase